MLASCAPQVLQNTQKCLSIPSAEQSEISHRGETCMAPQKKDTTHKKMPANTLPNM